MSGQLGLAVIGIALAYGVAGIGWAVKRGRGG